MTSANESPTPRVDALADLIRRAAAPMTCPRCDGAGIVDTSPPGVEERP